MVIQQSNNNIFFSLSLSLSIQSNVFSIERVIDKKAIIGALHTGREDDDQCDQIGRFIGLWATF